MDLYLSLGSNLGDKAANIRRALTLIGERVGEVKRVSALMQTKPVGFRSENDFLNAAARIETSLPVGQILSLTQEIERGLGRTSKSDGGRYADRPIDIDLLSYGTETVDTPLLRLPHPHMADRLFVLEPLAEIAPDLVIPGLGLSVSRLLSFRREARIGPLTADMDLTAVTEGLARLLPQLTEAAPEWTEARISDTFLRPDSLNRLFLITDLGGRIAGMGTLCLTDAPTGRKAWIEDVVIDRSARGRGWSRILLAHLIAEARHLRAKSVNLTSRPARLAANALYRSMGMELRETNVYKLGLNQ